MTDWTAPTGTGLIMLRDTGTTAEFWVAAGNPTAFDYDMGWSGHVNGVNVGGSFRYNPGAGWQRIAFYGVSTSQTVTFNKTGDSGSSGLGGPASVSGYFGRATTPAKQVAPEQDDVLPNQFRINYDDFSSNGGSPIDKYLIRVSKNNPPDKAPYEDFFDSNMDGMYVVTGRIPGTTYYVCTYAHNALGYSPKSTAIKVVTPNAVHVRVNGVWKYAIPWVKVAGVWKKAAPYVKVNGVWKKSG